MGVILIGKEKPANLDPSIMRRFSDGKISRIQIGEALAMEYLSFATKRWVVMVNHLNKNKNKGRKK